MFRVVRIEATCFVLIIYLISIIHVEAVKRSSQIVPTMNVEKAQEIFRQNGFTSPDSADHVCQFSKLFPKVLNGEIICYGALMYQKNISFFQLRFIVPPEGKDSVCESKRIFGIQNVSTVKMIRCKAVDIGIRDDELAPRSDFFLLNTPKKDHYYLYEAYGRSDGVMLKGVVELQMDYDNYKKWPTYIRDIKDLEDTDYLSSRKSLPMKRKLS